MTPADTTILIDLKGADASEHTVFDLQDWIRQEAINGLRHVGRPSAPPSKEHMGIDPVTVLSVVLAGPAIVELVKSIHVWIRTRRPKTKIRFHVGDNVIEVDSENLREDQDIIKELMAAAKEG